ncbi:MAG: ribose ABC transporter permease, partial [Spirochaetales bacterium]|nr:ribose ABC transporter permease [Spirochaetales bacterium]
MKQDASEALTLKKRNYLTHNFLAQCVRETMGILIGLALLCLSLASQSPGFLSKTKRLKVLR